jgi:hypothetical protein
MPLVWNYLDPAAVLLNKRLSEKPSDLHTFPFQTASKQQQTRMWRGSRILLWNLT